MIEYEEWNALLNYYYTADNHTEKKLVFISNTESRLYVMPKRLPGQQKRTIPLLCNPHIIRRIRTAADSKQKLLFEKRRYFFNHAGTGTYLFQLFILKFNPIMGRNHRRKLQRAVQLFPFEENVRNPERINRQSSTADTENTAPFTHL